MASDKVLDLDTGEFKRTLAATFKAMFPRWTDEDLLCLPREGIRFTAMMRHVAKRDDLSDYFILRTLTNIRKSGGGEIRSGKERSNINVVKELDAVGCKFERDAFGQLLADIFACMCPGSRDEELLCEPRRALDFCDTVRMRAHCKDLSDSFILRMLSNQRKRGDL